MENQTKGLPRWLQVILSLSGVIYGIIVTFVIPWLQDHSKMNPYKLTLDILALCSMGYGVYLVVRFLYDLKKQGDRLEKLWDQQLSQKALDQAFEKLAVKLGVKPEKR